jgi:hypothetical protein
LPKDAFSLEAINACLTGPVTDWSRRWFARTPAVVAAVRSEVCPSQAPAPDRQTVGACAALELSGRGKRHLLEAALDIDLSDQPLTESDRRLLDVFARKAVEDFIAALESMLPDTGNSTPGAQIVVTIAIGGKDVLTLEAPEQVFVPLIKKVLGGPRAAPRTVARRSEALRRTKMRAFGYLGRAEIGIGDLETLSAGDVLILDRALSEPVELRLAGSAAALARGKLCRNADQISLQL